MSELLPHALVYPVNKDSTDRMHSGWGLGVCVVLRGACYLRLVSSILKASGELAIVQHRRKPKLSIRWAQDT